MQLLQQSQRLSARAQFLQAKRGHMFRYLLLPKYLDLFIFILIVLLGIMEHFIIFIGHLLSGFFTLREHEASSLTFTRHCKSVIIALASITLGISYTQLNIGTELTALLVYILIMYDYDSSLLCIFTSARLGQAL